MRKTMTIAFSVLILSALACSTNGVASAPPHSRATAVPHVLQSNAPNVQWEFPQSDPITGAIPGPDGHIWGFAFANHQNVIYRFDVQHLRLQQFNAPIPIAYMAPGPDGNMWYCAQSTVGNVTPNGITTTYEAPNSGTGCNGIAAGPDGNIWVTDSGLSQLLRVTPQGAFSAYPLPNPSNAPNLIVGGKNDLVWFVEGNSTTEFVSNINVTSGLISEFPLPGAASQHAIFGLDSGADGNAYAVDQTSIGRIYRVTPAGTVRGFRIATVASEAQATQTGVRNIWIGSGSGLLSWSTSKHQLTNYGLPPSPPPPPKGPETAPIAGPDENVWMAGGVYILRVLTVAPPNATLQVNASQSFSITESDCSPCSWTATSSNSAVATVTPVSSGQFSVTGVSVGSATIRVTDRHRNEVKVPITVQ